MLLIIFTKIGLVFKRSEMRFSGGVVVRQIPFLR